MSDLPMPDIGGTPADFWDDVARKGFFDEYGNKPLARLLGYASKTVRTQRRKRECQACGKCFPMRDLRCPECHHDRTKAVEIHDTRALPDVMPGQRIKGLTTGRSFIDPDTGEKTFRWTKTEIDKDQREAKIQALIDSIPGFLEPLRGIVPPEPFQGDVDDDTLAAYVWGDPHFGMQAWAEETGDHWDLTTAIDAHLGAMASLIAGCRPAHTAVLALMGDNTHADDNKARTPKSGHPLDVCARHGQVGWALNAVVKESIAMLRRKHERVIAVILGGNHDESTAPYFEMAIHNAFEDEPRVEVNTQRGAMKWMQWGNEMLVFHHGHGMKPPEIAAAVSADPRLRPLFGATKHTHVYMGHVHHKEKTEHKVYKGVAGCTVEHVGTLAGRDAHTALHGYNSLRQMKLDYWHKEQGFDGGNVCGFTRAMAARGAA